MIIHSLLPNPVGNDREGEWIKILNNETGVVNLGGWRLETTRGKLYKLDDFNLNPGQDLVLTYGDLRFNLRNGGDELSLFNADGNLADVFEYAGPVVEGLVLEKNSRPEQLFEDMPQNFSAIQAKHPGDNFSWLWVLAAVALAATYVMSYYLKKWYKKI